MQGGREGQGRGSCPRTPFQADSCHSMHFVVNLHQPQIRGLPALCTWGVSLCWPAGQRWSHPSHTIERHASIWQDPWAGSGVPSVAAVDVQVSDLWVTPHPPCKSTPRSLLPVTQGGDGTSAQPPHSLSPTVRAHSTSLTSNTPHPSAGEVGLDHPLPRESSCAGTTAVAGGRT